MRFDTPKRENVKKFRYEKDDIFLDLWILTKGNLSHYLIEKKLKIIEKGSINKLRIQSKKINKEISIKIQYAYKTKKQNDF